MSSLSAHLRQPDDHSQLRFHPACPVCRRDRLAGSLTGDELVSRRVQAALAAGLLAFSASSPSVAVASEPDELSEGTSEVMAPGDSSASADFDPGSEEVELPDEAPATFEPAQPAAPESDDFGVLEQEPAKDVVEQTVSAAPAAPEALPVAPSAAEAPPVDLAPEGVEVQPASGGPKSERGERRDVRPANDAVAVAPAVAPAVEPVAAPAPAPAAAPPAAPVTTRVMAGADTGRATAGDRSHTVRRGESLWSIASDLVGDGASASRVAREVIRLWELNEDRIATGNPDVLYAGTRLRLR